jgi:hypothetical protein
MSYLRRIYLSDPDDHTRLASFDNLFKVPVFIDVGHHEIHEGDMYSVSVYDLVAAATDTVEVFILTPAVSNPQKRIHMLSNYEGSGAHEYLITEGCTYSSGGAAYVPKNRNRGSTKTTSAQSVYVGGDDQTGGNIVVTGGSALWADGGGAGRTNGGGDRSAHEWVLAPATGYLFTMTSGATSTAISLELTFYEHTDE